MVAMRLLVIATIQIVLAVYLYVLLRNGILKHFQEDIFLLASFVVQLAYLSQVAPICEGVRPFLARRSITSTISPAVMATHAGARLQYGMHLLAIPLPFEYIFATNS